MDKDFHKIMKEAMDIYNLVDTVELKPEEESFETNYNPSDVDWIVGSNGDKYDKDGNLILNHKTAFNFKVDDIITIGFLDNFGDISRAEKFKVIKNDHKHLVCKSIL